MNAVAQSTGDKIEALEHEIARFMDAACRRAEADGMRRRTLAATRQLAKRQLTWLRGWPWMKRLTWGEPAQLAAEIEHQLT